MFSEGCSPELVPCIDPRKLLLEQEEKKRSSSPPPSPSPSPSLSPSSSIIMAPPPPTAMSLSDWFLSLLFRDVSFPSWILGLMALIITTAMPRFMSFLSSLFSLLTSYQTGSTFSSSSDWDFLPYISWWNIIAMLVSAWAGYQAYRYVQNVRHMVQLGEQLKSDIPGEVVMVHKFELSKATYLAHHLIWEQNLKAMVQWLTTQPGCLEVNVFTSLPPAHMSPRFLVTTRFSNLPALTHALNTMSFQALTKDLSRYATFTPHIYKHIESAPHPPMNRACSHQPFMYHG